MFPVAASLLAQADGGPPLSFVTLRDHVGVAESVHLDVYFLGFPAELENDARAGLGNTLSGLNIIDAKPWWPPIAIGCARVRQ